VTGTTCAGCTDPAQCHAGSRARWGGWLPDSSRYPWLQFL